MARCYNCGCSISEEEKTRLCEKCQRILLPFIKLTSTSNTSSVRRLLSNEKNLRNAGVTDSGMQYLLKICELNDRSRAREKEEAEAAARQQSVLPTESEAENRQPDFYQDVEIPEDEPLNLIPGSYGALLPAVKILLAAAGVFLALWFGFRIVTASEVDFPAAAGAAACFCGAYLADAAAKLRHDLEEIKKRIR